MVFALCATLAGLSDIVEERPPPLRFVESQVQPIFVACMAPACSPPPAALTHDGDLIPVKCLLTGTQNTTDTTLLSFI